MEITIESIFQLFAESERQRLAQQKLNEAERLEQQKLNEAERLEQQKLNEAERLAQQKQNAAELKKISRDLSKKIADLGDALGLYAEAQVQARILQMFGQRGIELRTLTTHYQEKDRQGNFVYEIDILLYNTIYAIVVEVKHRLRKDDIDEHTERMQKCTELPPRGTEGKILLGAIAGMIVDNDVEKYAQRQGFFVLKPSGETVKITNNKQFVPKEWEVKA